MGAVFRLRVVYMVAAFFAMLTHTQLITMMALVASGTLGLAHGGLDWSLAKQWGLRTTWRDSLCFVLIYSTCVVLTLIFWQVLPMLALSGFLFISVVHFAGDWHTDMGFINRHVTAIAVVCLPTLRFKPEVKRIFDLLVSGQDADYLLTIMHDLAWFGVGWLGLNVAYEACKREQLALVVEFMVLLLTGLFLPPLVYFALYFCFLHAPKHWQSMRAMGVYHHLYDGVFCAAWPSVCAVLVGVLVIYDTTGALSFSDALCQTLFMGLAALTVPHWILIDIYGHNRAQAGIKI